jgi:hypothetical protein
MADKEHHAPLSRAAGEYCLGKLSLFILRLMIITKGLHLLQ